MHKCVAKLLKATDEESLECLCRLVTTVGQELETDTKTRLEKGGEAARRLRPMDHYFREMNKIIDEKKTSSRVRFLMQDVVDLRNNRWQKRREDAGPKTIAQIHEEVKNEQLKEKLNFNSTPAPPPSSRGGGGLRDDPRKRSVKGTSGGAGGLTDEGWQAAPTRPARAPNEKFDPDRVKNMISNSKRDVGGDMQLGPKVTSRWAQGSSGTKSSRHEEASVPGVSTIMQNRFSALSSSGGGLGGESSSGGGPHSAYDGRTSGGFSRGSRPGMSSGPSSSSYMGRGSRGQSSENDRAKAIQVN